MKFFDCFPKCLITTLDDKTAKGAIPHREKPLAGLHGDQKRKQWKLEELKKLNQQGAGIFFAYNQLGDSRSIENVKGINAWAMEIDDIPKGEQWKRIIKSPLNPSIIVESANSYHVYWLAKDGKIENAKKINSGLVQYFNSDPALKDISRLLRVPDFYHNKREPYLVNVVLGDYDVKYTEAEMLECFPFSEKKLEAPKWRSNSADDFWSAVNGINAMVGLERLSGSSMVNGEHFSFRERSGGGFFIDVNGQPADAWIDREGRIGSGKEGGPSLVNWLRFYGHDFKVIAEWFKNECRDLIPQRIFQKSKIIIPERKEIKGFVPYTWGTEGLDSKIWALKRHEVVCLAGVSSSGKTAFAYFLASQNAQLGHKVCYVVLEMSAQEIAERVAADAADFSKEEDRWEKFPEHKKEIYNQRLMKASDLKNLIMLDMPSLSIEEIFTSILAQGDVDMIFIDNFDRIGKSKGVNNDYESDNYKIKTILSFVKEKKIPVLLVHHINSKKALRKGGYGLADLRGSGKIVDECNTVFFLSRDMRKEATPEEKSMFFVQVKKHRRKGELMGAKIIFKGGEFADESGREFEKPEWWQNDI